MDIETYSFIQSSNHEHSMKNRWNLLPKLFRNKTSVLLGRWKIEQTEKQLHRKIDWSNEDHCGPCGKQTIAVFTIKPHPHKPPSK